MFGFSKFVILSPLTHITFTRNALITMSARHTYLHKPTSLSLIYVRVSFVSALLVRVCPALSVWFGFPLQTKLAAPLPVSPHSIRFFVVGWVRWVTVLVTRDIVRIGFVFLLFSFSFSDHVSLKINSKMWYFTLSPSFPSAPVIRKKSTKTSTRTKWDNFVSCV